MYICKFNTTPPLHCCTFNLLCLVPKTAIFTCLWCFAYAQVRNQEVVSFYASFLYFYFPPPRNKHMVRSSKLKQE
jgi:hypothetical protein